MFASQNGHTDIVTLLLTQGARVDLQNSNGWSSLMIASQSGQTEIVKLLLKFGAKVNLQNNDGSYALMVASQDGYIEVIKQLLKYGADINLKDNMGRSAFTEAKNNELLTLFTSHTKFNAENRSLEDSHELQDDSDTEKEQKLHLLAVENAIQDRGNLDHSLVHGVFVGPPRSGKDSLMKRLLGEMPTDTSSSTGVAENVVHMKVEKASTFAATVEQSNWARLAYDEEALHLMKTASSKRSDSITDQGESSVNEQLTKGSDPVVEETSSTILQTHEEASQSHTTSDKQSIIPQSAPLLEEQPFQTAKHRLPVHKHKPPIEIFKEAIKNKGLEGLKKQLAKSWSCLLYTSPSPRDATLSRMPSSA